MTGRDLGDRPAQHVDVVPGVLLPALPGRRLIANSSVVLSHHTPIGWKPNPPLNVAAACSFSEWRSPACVDVQHHHLAQIDSGDLRRRRLGQQTPHVTTDPCAGLLDPSQRRRAGLIQAPHTVGAEATGPSRGA